MITLSTLMLIYALGAALSVVPIGFLSLIIMGLFFKFKPNSWIHLIIFIPLLVIWPVTLPIALIAALIAKFF